MLWFLRLFVAIMSTDGTASPSQVASGSSCAGMRGCNGTSGSVLLQRTVASSKNISSSVLSTRAVKNSKQCDHCCVKWRLVGGVGGASCNRRGASSDEATETCVCRDCGSQRSCDRLAKWHETSNLKKELKERAAAGDDEAKGKLAEMAYDAADSKGWVFHFDKWGTGRDSAELDCAEEVLLREVFSVSFENHPRKLEECRDLLAQSIAAGGGSGSGGSGSGNTGAMTKEQKKLAKALKKKAKDVIALAEVVDNADDVDGNVQDEEGWIHAKDDDGENNVFGADANGGKGRKDKKAKAPMPAPAPGSGSGSGKSMSGDLNKTYNPYFDAQLSRCQQAHGHKISLGPRLVRMAFHDLADYNNLQFGNGTHAPVAETGLDGCLHPAVLSQGVNQHSDDEAPDDSPSDDADSEEDTIAGNPNHNKGLGNAAAWVLAMAEATTLSQPDAMVLGANVYLEAWAEGPELGFKWGRKTGHCNVPVCVKEDCRRGTAKYFVQGVAEPVGQGMMCPWTNTMAPLMDLLGLDKEHLVALQGAHSIGGIMMCAGMGEVSSGGFCPKESCPSSGRFANAGGFPKILGGRADMGYSVNGLGFGGTSFDDTPGKLDNRYYKLLADEEYDALPDCELVNPKIGNRQFSNYPNIHRGGSGGGAPEIERGEKEPCDSSKTISKGNVMCKERAFSHLYNTTTPGVFGFPDSRAQCSAGVDYANENQCDVEKCVEKCMETAACKEYANVLSVDYDARREATLDCNLCKLDCKGATHYKGGNQKRDVNWCKSLPKVAECLGPYTTGHRRGANNCGACPGEMCVQVPNLGQGRSAAIKNLKRWTAFRGLAKRVMVLPSDWSYLADPELKKHFKSYANDEQLFHTKFSEAWNTVTALAPTVSTLQQCTPVGCTASSGKITCPLNDVGYIGHREVLHEDEKSGEKPLTALKKEILEFERPEALEFTECDGHPSDGDCQLIGGFGVKAKFLCGDTTMFCLTERARKNLDAIKDEHSYGGGKEAMCGDE